MNRFRTLFRVIAIDDEGIWCVLPAWSSKCAIWIPSLSLPFSVESIGYRFHGEVMLGAESPDDLNPSDYEH